MGSNTDKSKWQLSTHVLLWHPMIGAGGPPWHPMIGAGACFAVFMHAPPKFLAHRLVVNTLRRCLAPNHNGQRGHDQDAAHCLPRRDSLAEQRPR